MGKALFRAGDCLLLVLVSSIGVLLMHGIHMLEWPFVLEMLAGMGAAMLVQMLLALASAPLLGSIETMVPSSVAAMVSPMAVCLAHMADWRTGSRECLLLGTVLGIGMFAVFEVYASVCRRALRRSPWRGAIK
ncbi:hypothetical protein HZA57_06155 [Candidatus Poribacteria bacterium]|nr:hypothetical protein [Candidatus Poribacteria bacterium]